MIHKCEIDVQILMRVHALKTVVAFYYIIINTFFKVFIAIILHHMSERDRKSFLKFFLCLIFHKILFAGAVHERMRYIFLIPMVVKK